MTGFNICKGRRTVAHYSVGFCEFWPKSKSQVGKTRVEKCFLDSNLTEQQQFGSTLNSIPKALQVTCPNGEFQAQIACHTCHIHLPFLFAWFSPANTWSPLGWVGGSGKPPLTLELPRGHFDHQLIFCDYSPNTEFWGVWDQSSLWPLLTRTTEDFARVWEAGCWLSWAGLWTESGELTQANKKKEIQSRAVESNRFQVELRR